jgi:L-asparaginase
MKNLSHKKILVIHTGGTIGMVSTEQSYDIEAGFLSNAIQGTSDFYHCDMPSFEVKEYSYLIDSSNVKPEWWASMMVL